MVVNHRRKFNEGIYPVEETRQYVGREAKMMQARKVRKERMR